jgi:hypothetical protein
VDLPATGKDKDSPGGVLSSTGSAGNSAVSLASGRESPSIPLLTRTFLGKQTSQFNVKKLKTGALPGEGLTAASMGYCRGGAIVRTINTTAAAVVQAERKRELRLREINNDIEKGNALLRSLKLPQVDYLAFPCRYSVGTSVVTMFGAGIITNFRSEDGIYEVQIGWESNQEEAEAPSRSRSLLGGGKEDPLASRPTNTRSGIADTQEYHAVAAEAGADAAEDEDEDGMVSADMLPRDSSASSTDPPPRKPRGGIIMFISGVAIHSQ